MLATRPDLSFAVDYFGKYQYDRTEVRWKGFKRVLRYIKGTLNVNFYYTEVSCFVDADYGSETDRKSTSEFLHKFLGTQLCGPPEDSSSSDLD